MPCTPESRDASSARNDADDSPAAVRPRHADVGADGHVEEMVRVYEREPPADAHPTPPLRGGVKAAPAAPPPPPPPPPTHSSSSMPHPQPSRRQVPRRTTQGGRFNISRTLRNFLPSSSASSASASASAAAPAPSAPAAADPFLHSTELPPPPPPPPPPSQRTAPNPSSPATPAAVAAAATAGSTDSDDSIDSPCEAEVSFGADTPSPRASGPEERPPPPAAPTHTPPTHGHAESDSDEESDRADDGYPVGSGGLPPPPVRHPPVFSTFSAPPPSSPPTSASATAAPRASPAGVRPAVVTPISHRRSPGGVGVGGGSPLGSSGSPQAPPEEIVSEAPGSRAAAADEATAAAAAATTRVTSAEPWGTRPGLARDAVRRTQGPVRTPVTPLSPAPAQQQQLEEEYSDEEEEEAIEAPEAAAPEGSQRLCDGCGSAKQQWTCVGCSEAVAEAKAEARQEWMARARLDQELMQLKDRHKKLADRVSSGKEEADDLEEDLADANVVISRQHRRIDALTGELEKRQEQQFTAIEELAEAKSVLKQQHARIEELFHESNEEKRKRQSAEGWLFQLREQCLRLKDVVDDRDAYRLRIERLERQYEDERALRKSVQDNYNTLWDRSAALETTEREVRRELDRKHSETEAMRRAWYQMNNELSKARESVHSLNKYNAHLQQRMQDEEGSGRETVQSAMTALASQGIDEINDAQASALASSLSEITPHVVASLFREQAEPKQYIKRMMATMHPDKTSIPACKETLQKRFQILNHCRSLLS